MQKPILSCFFTLVSIAIASTASTTSVDAETMGEYIDSSSPQVIERISGNIVTFNDKKVGSRNYYVPNWMFNEYDLKVGSEFNLYNRNVIQGIYRGTARTENGGAYIEIVSQGLPSNLNAFEVHDTRRYCTMADSPASEGLGWGSRVWYKSECCPSTIPVVGAMWSYRRREIVAIEQSVRQIIPPPPNTIIPAPVNNAPVQGLW